MAKKKKNLREKKTQKTGQAAESKTFRTTNTSSFELLTLSNRAGALFLELFSAQNTIKAVVRPVNAFQETTRNKYIINFIYSEKIYSHMSLEIFIKHEYN